MKKRILIVDDDPNLAFLLAENLTDLGPDFEIETCHTGTQAIALNQINPFDLVITDLIMPGLSGLQVIRRLSHLYPGIKLMLMTSYGNEYIVSNAKKMGDVSYIAKPFSIEDMLTAIKQMLFNQSLNKVY